MKFLKSVVLLVILPFILNGQSGANLSLKGNVIDQISNEPIIGVSVGILNLKTSTLSKLDGSFRFDKLKPGAYNLHFTSVGFQAKDTIVVLENSKSFLYQIPYPQSSTTTSALKPLAQLGLDFLTSGAISADGMDILLRNKSQIWYWKRDKTESVLQALAKKPQDAPYAGNEHQGEAISFSYNTPGFMTISEIRDYPGDIAKISFYKRK